MAAFPAKTMLARLTDPYGFSDAFRDLGLAPEDLPSMTRECRMAGSGG